MAERCLNEDEDQEIEAAWDAVADAREDGLKSGGAKPVPLGEARARLEARCPGRSSGSIPQLECEDVVEAAVALRRGAHSLILDTRPRRRAGRDAGGAA